MIINKILGNINDLNDSIKERPSVEKVSLTNDEMLKRVQRVKTDKGRDLGIRLSGFTKLKMGDILYKDNQTMIVVDMLPQSVIMIKPRSMKEMGIIAHQLGNRHLPAQFEKNVMFVQEDSVTQQLLENLQIPFEMKMRKMNTPFRYLGHHHD